jgi:molybdate transport system substrate-binding protein
MRIVALLGLLLAHAAAHATLTVLAAASLKEALDEAAAAWRAGGGEPTAISYAASSALARQVEHGAPADVFISADRDWMDYLEQRALLRPGTRVDWLRNTLVLVAPAAAAAAAPLPLAPGFPLAARLGGGRLAVGDPDHVPAGKYAKAALQWLGAWAQVEARLARADNVRGALNFVARGEAALGIVYRTDAAAEPRVRIVGTFPAAAHAPIVYPAAVLAAAARPEAARFLAFLRSPRALAILERHGFTAY